MPTNPFTDAWHFLTATTSDYLKQGNWRYLILALFWALRSSALRWLYKIGGRIRRSAPAAISACGWCGC
jgi:hypothetical protein